MEPPDTDFTEIVQKVKQVDKDRVVNDLCAIIRFMPLTEEHIQKLWNAISERVDRAAH